MLYSQKSLAVLASAVGLASDVALAISFPFVRTSSSKAANGTDDFHFQNHGDIVYQATIQVLGQDFQVQLDTGSSDLWIDTTGIDISGLIQTGQSTSAAYGDGTVAEGPIVIGNVTFGDFTVSTALISAPGSNATSHGDNGLLGVGPPTSSQIRNQMQNSTFNGDTVLENVFASNPSLPTFMTFQLARSEVTSLTDGGVFTIGEVDSNFSSILSAPQLPVTNPIAWVVLMDSLNVNGQPVATQNQDITLLDTGTTLAQLPKAYVDAIYGSVPGAVFDAASGAYTVPCDAKLNISFSFGGIPYPVHPIDVVAPIVDASGQIGCISAFGVSPPANSGTGVDFIILGDSFLRNVYSLFAFGPETSAVNGTPPAYIQILSTTNIDQAFAEFDELSAQRNASLLVNNTSSSGGSSGNGTGSGGNSGNGTTSGNSNGADSTLPMSLTTSILSVLSVALGMLLV